MGVNPDFASRVNNEDSSSILLSLKSSYRWKLTFDFFLWVVYSCKQSSYWVEYLHKRCIIVTANLFWLTTLTSSRNNVDTVSFHHNIASASRLVDESGSLYLLFRFNHHHFERHMGPLQVCQLKGLQIPDQKIHHLCTGGNQLERKGLMQHSWIFGGLEFETMNYSFVALKWMWKEFPYHS